MTDRIQFTPAAKRQFDKLPGLAQKQLGETIDRLAEQPRPPQSAKLAGHDLYRVRRGDHRVVYRIEDDRLQVVLVKMGHRKDIYRR